jgi:iron complex transport system substrate-binding protein
LAATLGLALLVAGSAGAARTASAIVLNDSTGRTVTLNAPAKRIVALEWSYAEDVLALQVPLVGVADIPGYRSWLRTPPIKTDGSVTDVGTRAQPSLEKIAALRPDLIITSVTRVGDTLSQLSAIAPTLVFNAYPTNGRTQYDDMVWTFNMLAKATGKQARAAQLLKQLNGTYASAKKLLAKRGVTKHTVTTTQAFTTGGQSVARLFTPSAMVAQILEKIGLKDGWNGDPGQFGFTSVGLESLSKLPEDSYLLFVAQSNDNPFAGSWLNNPAYQALPIVKAGRVLSLRADTWFFGGPLSAGQLVRQVVARLAPA